MSEVRQWRDDEECLEAAKAAFRGDEAWRRPVIRPADDASPWHWPYCEAPYCHNVHTSDYATTWGKTVAGWTAPPQRFVHVTPGSRRGASGNRLCTSHALLRFKVAFG